MSAFRPEITFSPAAETVTVFVEALENTASVEYVIRYPVAFATPLIFTVNDEELFGETVKVGVAIGYREPYS